MSSYSVADVAKMLEASEESVRRWIRDGKLQAKRGLGRNGNSISLNDIVDFVNIPPRLYLNTFAKWLDHHNIEYDRMVYMTTEDHDDSDSSFPVASVAGAAALGSTFGPFGATIGATSAIIGNQLLRKSRKPYTCEQIRLRPATEIGCLPAITEDATVDNETDQVVQESVVETDKEARKIQAKMISEQMKLLKLKQELAKITADISICESQIEYYKLMLEK